MKILFRLVNYYLQTAVMNTIEEKVKTCLGITKSGKRCAKSVKSELKYCWKHKTQELNSSMDVARFNEECPICFATESKGMLILSCLHRIHSECAEGLTDTQCPMCRKEVINWPKSLLAKIKENAEDRKQELIDEDTQHIREQERLIREMTIPHMTLLLQPPPRIEIISALLYLREQGIPMSYIPQNVRITRTRGHPNFQPGVLFTAIIGQVIERMQRDIFAGPFLVEREDYTKEGSEDDTEDPFEDENEKYIEIDRSINFNEDNDVD